MVMDVIPSERPAYIYVLATSFDDLGEASETYPNFIIDPQGDLQLEVRTENEDSNRTFWVASSSVRHGSSYKIWLKMTPFVGFGLREQFRAKVIRGECLEVGFSSVMYIQYLGRSDLCRL